MEETVIDQQENQTTDPVEPEELAPTGEELTTLEVPVDTPESSGESSAPVEDVAQLEDEAVAAIEIDEAPVESEPIESEEVVAEVEVVEIDDASETVDVVEEVDVVEVVEVEAETAEQAIDPEVVEVELPAAPEFVAADAIIAAAEERSSASSEAPEAEAESTEPEEPPIPVELLAWGFIDQNRKIHQNSTDNYRGHVVGKAYDNPEVQIAELETNFSQFVKDADLIETDTAAAKNKVGILGRIRKLKAAAGKADALGDFDALFARLRTLEAALIEEIDAKKITKEALIARAEEIKESTDWRVTGEAYKALFEEWKAVGATGKESDDSLWARFIGAREYFNQRRSQHFEQRQEAWGTNAALKQELIVKAHELSTSDDWRNTSNALRDVFAEWKKVGSAGRQQDEELWKQFREAQQHFYDRRTAFFEDNKARKEALAARAIELSNSTDWDATFDEMKTLMADWRTIGSAGNRDLDNKLWDTFRGAQNVFFERRFETQAKREQDAREAVKGKEAIVAAVEALAYSGDAVTAQEEAEQLKAQFDALPEIRKDRDDALNRRLRKAMGDLKVNAAAEGARRSVAWEGKIREALYKSGEQIESLRNSVAANEEAIAVAQAELATASGDERTILQETIEALKQSVAEGNAEIERLQSSIQDVESSLR